jgi:hypothetical protein
MMEDGRLNPQWRVLFFIVLSSPPLFLLLLLLLLFFFLAPFPPSPSLFRSSPLDPFSTPPHPLAPLFLLLLFLLLLVLPSFFSSSFS